MTEIARRLTKEEARTLTDEIKQAAEHTYTLLLRAHEGEAWAALGYNSWRDYATTEFSMSQSRAYQLLDQARIVRSIEAASDSTNVELPNEGQARELSRIPEPERVEVWRETVERTAGQPSAAAVRETYAARADEVVDAELVDEPARPEPPKQKRRPLPEAFTDAGRDLTRAAERLTRLTEDDRFPRNRHMVHGRMTELMISLEQIAALINAADLPSKEDESLRQWWAERLNTISNVLVDIANNLS